MGEIDIETQRLVRRAYKQNEEYASRGDGRPFKVLPEITAPLRFDPSADPSATVTIHTFSFRKETSHTDDLGPDQRHARIVCIENGMIMGQWVERWR